MFCGLTGILNNAHLEDPESYQKDRLSGRRPLTGPGGATTSSLRSLAESGADDAFGYWKYMRDEDHYYAELRSLFSSADEDQVVSSASHLVVAADEFSVEREHSDSEVEDLNVVHLVQDDKNISLSSGNRSAAGGVQAQEMQLLLQRKQNNTTPKINVHTSSTVTTTRNLRSNLHRPNPNLQNSFSSTAKNRNTTSRTGTSNLNLNKSNDKPNSMNQDEQKNLQNTRSNLLLDEEDYGLNIVADSDLIYMDLEDIGPQIPHQRTCAFLSQNTTQAEPGRGPFLIPEYLARNFPAIGAFIRTISKSNTFTAAKNRLRYLVQMQIEESKEREREGGDGVLTTGIAEERAMVEASRHKSDDTRVELRLALEVKKMFEEAEAHRRCREYSEYCRYVLYPKFCRGQASRKNQRSMSLKKRRIEGEDLDVVDAAESPPSPPSPRDVAHGSVLWLGHEGGDENQDDDTNSLESLEDARKHAHAQLQKEQKQKQNTIVPKKSGGKTLSQVAVNNSTSSGKRTGRGRPRKQDGSTSMMFLKASKINRYQEEQEWEEDVLHLNTNDAAAAGPTSGPRLDARTLEAFAKQAFKPSKEDIIRSHLRNNAEFQPVPGEE
ncbi:unnamed protein product [Amoebophrya sp. A25]|nr:unnamed protein product [Amoebophrya sp. A25]|eukprot:GSA25T00026471001.1